MKKWPDGHFFMSGLLIYQGLGYGVGVERLLCRMAVGFPVRTVGEGVGVAVTNSGLIVAITGTGVQRVYGRVGIGAIRVINSEL